MGPDSNSPTFDKSTCNYHSSTSAAVTYMTEVECGTYIGKINHFVFFDGLRNLVNLVGNTFWSWSTILHIVLDSEICFGSSRVMTSRQQDTSRSFLCSNNVGNSRGRKDSFQSDNEFRYSITGREFDDGLNDFW